MNIQPSPSSLDPVPLGAEQADRRLRTGFAQAALHDLYADPGDGAAALGFACLLALRAAGGKPVMIVRDDRSVRDQGRLHGDGVADLGLDPAELVVVHAADSLAALRVAADAAACPELGALILQPGQPSPAFGLTASRRLASRARASGVFTLAVRVGAVPVPSAATTRWRIRSAASTALAANAPGPPAFDIGLIHHRLGIAGFDACVEWNRDQRCFSDAPLSRRSPAVAAGRACDPGERRAA